MIGGYTAEMGGTADGVTSVVETGSGRFEVVDTLVLPSPTYLIRHPEQPWLFAVSEGDTSLVTSFRRDPDGRLTLLSSVESGGELACHLALTPDARYLVVAHYGSGSVSSVPVGADGRLGERRDLWPCTGKGPDPARQRGPHAHQVVFDGEELLVSDLGADRLHRLRVDADGRFFAAALPIDLPPGSGPRHLVIVEDHLVVACELSAQLWLARRKAGGWRQVHTMATSAARVAEPIAPSAIRVDGLDVFVANRGPGSISVFRLDPTTSTLSPTDEFDCGGPGPRDLVVEPAQLWVANQTVTWSPSLTASAR